MGSRLIEAQEQERKRIARDLHESIGQQLALIALRLQQFRSKEKLARGTRLQKLTELLEDTENVAKEVQALSHKLHSSSLDYLGLTAAIEGFCLELRKRHHVEIDFRGSGVPANLRPETALAFFRICQEALHNPLKRSGVTRYEVRLKGTRTHLELKVSDTGAGFDVRQAARGEGLGLISMRERVVPLNGVVTIRSRHGRGARRRVRVPIDITRPPAPPPRQ